jgi:FdhD protein
MTSASRPVSRIAWRQGVATCGERIVPEETPIAVTYNRATYAVMLASPADIEDFAIGFSLTEGVIAGTDDIEELEIVTVEQGAEARMWLPADLAEAVQTRRRHLTGATGCGLCGLESLAEAARTPRTVIATATFTPQQVATAIAALPSAQELNRLTRAVHAAALWTPQAGLVALREDVGRHNALDKLAGTLLRQGIGAGDGILLLSSRVSIEMIQKAAILGPGVMVAISSPTAMAIRQAEAAGITLVGVARDDGFEVFTHAHRIAGHVGA